MSPEQQTLLNTLSDDIKRGDWTDLLIFLLFAWAPSIVTFVGGYLKDRKIDNLQKDRIKDKQSEIDRLAARIKELENLSLRYKRK